MKNFQRIDEERQEKPIRLDKKDKRIISILSNNSRIPLTQLTKQVSLSRDGIKYRIKRLEKEGVILGFIPQISSSLLGFRDYHVFFGIDEDKDKEAEFIAYLDTQPYVKKLIEYSDKYDYEAVLMARSVEEFDQNITSITSKFKSVIIEKDMSQFIRPYLTTHIPSKIHISAHSPAGPRFRKISMDKFDDKDLSIIKELSRDARTPFYLIAKKIGLTGEAVSYRLKRLFSTGLIRRYTCVLDFNRLGFHWYTFLMRVNDFNFSHDKKLHKFLNSDPYVVKCIKTFGFWDLIFYIAADSHRAFHLTVKKIKTIFSDILKDYETLIAYKEHFYKPIPVAIYLKES